MLTPVELASRFEIYAEQYILAIEVEAKLVVSMAKTAIYPAAMSYLSALSATFTGLKGLGVELDTGSLTKVSGLVDTLMASVEKLTAAIAQHDFATPEEHMQFCAKTIRPLMDEVRLSADALEGEVADELWPFPNYQEMLFIK